MRNPRPLLRLGAVSTALVLVGAGVASAAVLGAAPTVSSVDGGTDSALVDSHALHKHGGQAGHLEPVNRNMRLVGQMRVNQDQEGRVADVGIHEGHAYVGAFSEPRCQKGGVYVFDLADLTAPKQIAFVPTASDSYVGEGVQALSVSTPSFTGDLLVFNNEICSGQAGKTSSSAVGGISLVDVSNPKKPVVLASGVGDVSPGGTRAHTVHSTFVWQPDARTAYAVTVDNEESADIDILDISDPRRPRLVAEYDLDSGTKILDGGTTAQPSGIPAVADAVKGDSESFLHDMVVKRIGGRQVLLASYWDGGYVKLDVTDPRNATYLADTDFAASDEELAQAIADGRVSDPTPREPEGNAHQAEFTLDDRYVLAADEDFSPTSFTASSDRVGAFDASSGDGTTPLDVGQRLSAPAQFVGRACTGDVAVPRGDGTALAMVERGVCTFTEKVGKVAAAGGWLGVVVVNRQGSDACSDTLGMSVTGTLPAFGVVSRAVAARMLGVAYDEAACRAAVPQTTVTQPYTPLAPLGTSAGTLSFESFFDGWGYVRLFDNGSKGQAKGKLRQLDTFAIPEAHDPRYRTGSGDLSVHEVATSAVNPRLAYVSYYSGGTRVLDVTGGTIKEVGAVIEPGGSNVWGVEVFRGKDGKEYVAASDRDFGISIYEYTGPGRPNP